MTTKGLKQRPAGSIDFHLRKKKKDHMSMNEMIMLCSLQSRTFNIYAQFRSQSCGRALGHTPKARQKQGRILPARSGQASTFLSFLLTKIKLTKNVWLKILPGT